MKKGALLCLAWHVGIHRQQTDWLASCYFIRPLPGGVLLLPPASLSGLATSINLLQCRRLLLQHVLASRPIGCERRSTNRQSGSVAPCCGMVKRGWSTAPLCVRGSSRSDYIFSPFSPLECHRPFTPTIRSLKIPAKPTTWIRCRKRRLSVPDQRMLNMTTWRP